MSATATFDGNTLTAEDRPRLDTQLDAVRSIMLDGHYRSLEHLAAEVTQRTGRRATEASVSARLRDLRKDKFGGYQVNRKSDGEGLFLYQVTF
jgi:hypothetical protein